MKRSDLLHDLSNKFAMIDLGLHRVHKKANPELLPAIEKMQMASEQAIEILKQLKNLPEED